MYASLSRKQHRAWIVSPVTNFVSPARLYPMQYGRAATCQKMKCFFALKAKKHLLFGLFGLLKMRVQAIQPYRIRETLME